MSERLRPRDLVFLSEETLETPMHNATVETFEVGDSGFDHDRLIQLIWLFVVERGRVVPQGGSCPC